MTDGTLADKWYEDIDFDADLNQFSRFDPLTNIGSTLNERGDDRLIRNVLRNVTRFICGYKRSAVELSSSGASLNEDERLDTEERDDPAVEVRGHHWVIDDDEAFRTDRAYKLLSFLDYLKSTPGSHDDSAPYISEFVADQAEKALIYFVLMGMAPEIAPDPEGGLSIRLENDGRVAILSVDDQEWHLVVNPLDNSQRIVKTFPSDTAALKFIKPQIG